MKGKIVVGGLVFPSECLKYIRETVLKWKYSRFSIIHADGCRLEALGHGESKQPVIWKPFILLCSMFCFLKIIIFINMSSKFLKDLYCLCSWNNSTHQLTGKNSWGVGQSLLGIMILLEYSTKSSIKLLTRGSVQPSFLHCLFFFLILKLKFFHYRV